MKTQLALLSVAISCSFASTPLEAGVLYYLKHAPDTFGNTVAVEEFSGSSEINYNFSGSTDPNFTVNGSNRNQGHVQARVGRGEIGITATANNNGQYLPQRQEVTGRFTFDVVFSSAGSSPIDVAMNLNLSGIIFEATSGYSTVQVRAGRTTNAFSGSYSEVADGVSPPVQRSGMLSGFVADGTVQQISTGVMTGIPVNVPVSMFIELFTGQAYTNPTIQFGDTFSLAKSGAVFNIVGGATSPVTVNSTDAGIVNNQFGGSAVPEPTSLAVFAIIALLGIGLPLRLRRISDV